MKLTFCTNLPIYGYNISIIQYLWIYEIHVRSFATFLSCIPIKPIFFSELLEQRQIIFGNMISIALKNLTNLWKYDIRHTLITNWYKI